MERKYPLKFFINGIVLNIFKAWYLWIPLLVLSVIKIFYPPFPGYIIIILGAVLLIYAIVTQLIYRHTSLHSDHPAFDEMFGGEGDAGQNIRDMINRIIEENRENEDFDDDDD